MCCDNETNDILCLNYNILDREETINTNKIVKHKINREEFIATSNIVHGEGTYGYSKVVLQDHTALVCITCFIHGDFWQSFYDHMKGHKCKKCGIESRAKMRTLTTEEFIIRALSVHGTRYNYSKVIYISGREKIIIGCPIHGDFTQSPGDHLSGRGCMKCGLLSTSKSNTTNREDYINIFLKVHGNRYDYSEFTCNGGHIPTIIICREHGRFNQSPSNHSKGQGCPKCAHIVIGNSHKYSKVDFIDKACSVHGYDKYDYSLINYLGSNIKVCIICKNCNFKFWQTPRDHLNGRGCPHCRESKGEKDIRDWLIINGIEFMPQYSYKELIGFERPLYFDFYVPSAHLLIEFDGEQHYKPVRFGGMSKEKSEESYSKSKERDALKNKYCLDHDLPLLRISYKDKEKISSILTKNIL